MTRRMIARTMRATAPSETPTAIFQALEEDFDSGVFEGEGPKRTESVGS